MKIFRAFWGLFLIFIGIILLLNTSFGLSWGIWVFIWQFWPIILIIFGLIFIFEARKVSFWTGLIILLVIFTSAGYGLYLSWQNKYFDNNNFALKNEEIIEEKIANELPANIEEVKVKLNLGVSKTTISGSDDQSLLYVGAHLSNFFHLNQKIHTTGRKAEVEIKTNPVFKTLFQPKAINDLNLSFSSKPNYEFEINTGASELDLNFEALKLKKIDISGGATKMKIKFGNIEDAEAEIKAGASLVKLEAPETSGIKIILKSALVTNNFEDLGLKKKDSGWVSPDYEDSERRIEVKIDAGASSVEISRY